MTLREFNPQWAWIVTQWLTKQNTNKKGMRIGMNDQDLDPISFRHKCNQPANRFYFFFKEQLKQPLGMVALSEIDLNSKNARLWYVLGDTNPSAIKSAAEAVNELAKIAFETMDLSSINAWCICNDSISKGILKSNHFNFIGRRRKCYFENGELKDKLLFDLLPDEHQELITEPKQRGFIAYHERSSLQNLSH